MAILDRIKFDSPSDAVLVWKHPSEQLKFGSQLIVNHSQEALFVKGGQALDLFGPGTHTLSTGNIPLLDKLVNLPFGGDTPFTAEVWFISKTVKRDMKWGTKAPIPLIDPLYNYPVNVRAFGQWGMRIEDSRSFLAQIVGTQGMSESTVIEDYFIGEIVQRLSDALARFFLVQKTSVFQANAKLNELALFTANDIRKEFARFGIEIVNFNVERISIPDDEMKRFQDVLGKRMEIDQISQAQVGQAYTTMRTFDTLERAAQNEGGGAGALLSAGLGVGMGLGAGVQIGQQVGQAMNTQPPSESNDPMVRLQKLKQMFEMDIITQDDYNAKKKQILDNI